MRGLDHDKTAQAMLKGNQIYYNYLRPHLSLEGKTPAQEAGIDLQLKGNKWEELIRRAKRNPKVIKEKKDA